MIKPYKIILASHSPRRQELLRGLDVSFEVKVKEGIPEDYPADLDTVEIPKFIAQKKAAAYEMARAFSVVTNVTFKELSDAEIDYYIEKYQPFDKAGSYGIQEWIGYIGVTKLEGSYFNVMGLPVQRIYEELNKMK